MKRNIAGISKRHMRRLVAKEIQTEKRSKISENMNKTEVNENVASVAPDKDQIVIDVHVANMQIDEAESAQENKSLRDDLAEWTVQFGVPRNACKSLLTIMSKRGMDVPKSYKTLIKIEKENLKIVEIAPGQYYHFGIERALNLIKLSIPTTISCVLIDVGIDGLPLFKSSGQTMWPIIGAISKCRAIKPFLIGDYIGNKKPENINLYLRDFVTEVLHLKNTKIDINGTLLDFEIRLFSVDTPARAFITGVVGHTSSIGCSKCKQKARRINKRLSYETSKSEPRTDIDFSNRLEKEYHLSYVQEKGSNILEKIHVKMVTQFPLDVMHLIDLGVGKKIVSLIWQGKIKEKLSAEQKLAMDAFLVIPIEFCRKPRSFNELFRWKATEFRQILLYTGLVVFKKFLHPDMYYNFLLLHCAYRMIACPSNCDKNLDCVQAIALLIFYVPFSKTMSKKFHILQPYIPTPIPRCNADIGSEENFPCAQPEENITILLKEVQNLQQTVSSLHFLTEEMNAKVDSLNAKVTRQEIILKRISTDCFPDDKDFKIFPIKSVDALKEIDGNIENLPRAELIAYIKNKLGNYPISKSFSVLFTEDVVMKMNWDGVKNKEAVKKFKLFHDLIFEAIKGKITFCDYEKEMKTGFKNAKNRLYKKTYRLKSVN